MFTISRLGLFLSLTVTLGPWAALAKADDASGGYLNLAQAEGRKKAPKGKTIKKAMDKEANPDASYRESATGSGQGSSWDARASKHYGVGLRAGTVVSSLMGGGLDLFMQQKGSWQYGLSIGSGSADLKSDVEDKTKYPDINVDVAKMDATLILAQARYFFGNSFYMGGGLGQRTINVKYGLSSLDGADGVSGEVKSNSIVAHFMLGNLWAWPSGFYIGADWFAVTLPISHAYSTTTQTKGLATVGLENFQKETEDLGETIGKTTSFQLAYFHMGWMF